MYVKITVISIFHNGKKLSDLNEALLLSEDAGNITLKVKKTIETELPVSITIAATGGPAEKGMLLAVF